MTLSAPICHHHQQETREKKQELDLREIFNFFQLLIGKTQFKKFFLWHQEVKRVKGFSRLVRAGTLRQITLVSNGFSSNCGMIWDKKGLRSQKYDNDHYLHIYSKISLPRRTNVQFNSSLFWTKSAFFIRLRFGYLLISYLECFL